MKLSQIPSVRLNLKQPKVITITNVKGGVGKSISALFLANILAEDKKVLLIDLDSQNSLTSFYFEDYSEIENKTILEALLGEIDIKDIVKPISENLDFIPADISLSNLTNQLTENREFKLYSILESIKGNYDYIVIDTPPSLHIETKLALAVSNFVIIPTLLEKWAIRSIEIVLHYIETKNIPLQKIIKASLDNVLILPTMLEKNRKIQDIVLNDLKEKYQDRVLDGISRKTDIQKLSYIGKDIKLKGLEAYKEYKGVLESILEPVKA